MLTTLALLTSNASACGGFFCNRAEPVKQKGETVVFEIDKGQNRTTMHVQVEYAGPAAEFAWVIPVKGTPDLQLSHEKLFQELEMRTRPAHQYYGTTTGECPVWDWLSGDTDLDGFSANDDGDPSPAPGVDVLAEAQVGPYDTVVVAADNEAVLLDWLQDNAYAVPDGMGPLLAPYLADGHNFVALKLQSGNEVGDLEPLALTYAGTRPAIPLHLTAVAAEDDMPMTAFVLGDARAVPDNYLHVEVNEAAIDWFGWGSNYEGLITRAADQAGGHAFATDYAGATEDWEHAFFLPAYEDLTLRASSDAQDFVSRVISSGLPPTAELQAILETHVPVPPTYDARSVYNRPQDYPQLNTWHPNFDVEAAVDDIETTILTPLQDIQEMFDRQPHLTRLRSSISPAEMTLDPMFALNPDIVQDVPRVRQAILETHCDDMEDWNDWADAKRELVLPSGMRIDLPSQNWLWENGMNESSWLAQMNEPAASRIEDLSSQGLPEVLYDGTVEIRQQVDALNDEVADIERSSRGCDATGGIALGWLALVLPLVVRRR